MSVTLQIELSELDAALLINEASRRGISVSELLPRLMRGNSDPQSISLTDEQYAADPLWSISGMAQTGATDASVNHDEYVYDEDR